MGQAKQRGTFEQRKAQAIKERAAEQLAWEIHQAQQQAAEVAYPRLQAPHRRIGMTTVMLGAALATIMRGSTNGR